MHFRYFPLNDETIQKLDPEMVYLVKVIAHQYVEIFQMQRETITAYYNDDCNGAAWRQAAKMLSITQPVSNALWEQKTVNRREIWYWKRTIPFRYHKDAEYLILLDQFWSRQWMIHVENNLDAMRILRRLARRRNPAAPFYKVSRT